MPSLVDYYAFLVQLTAPIRAPLIELSYNVEIPFLAALVLGMIGALSPCQLSTNLAAFAFISREVADPNRVARSVAAYLVGKIIVYSAVGGTAILLGVQLAQASIPFVVFTRKALGPILILLGLLMLGVIKLSVPFFAHVSEHLKNKWVEQHDTRGSFLLGTVFFCRVSHAFRFILRNNDFARCRIRRRGDVPRIFAVGTTLPLMIFVMLAAWGAQSIAPFVRNLRAVNLWMMRLAAIVFILVGVNEIVLYWLI